MWVDELQFQKYKDLFLSIQKKMLLRVASAFNTIPSEALQDITGTPPLEVNVKGGTLCE